MNLLVKPFDSVSFTITQESLRQISEFYMCCRSDLVLEVNDTYDESILLADCSPAIKPQNNSDLIILFKNGKIQTNCW